MMVVNSLDWLLVVAFCLRGMHAGAQTAERRAEDTFRPDPLLQQPSGELISRD